MRSLTNGGTYSFVASVIATNYTNTGLANDGTTYYYVVNALNAVAQSTNSMQVSASLPEPPSAPSGLTATAGNTQVWLSWNPAANANSYFVKNSTTNGGPYAVAANLAGLAFTNTGLANGTNYYFIVTATNSAGESTNSFPVSARPVSPAAPQLISGVSNNQLQFAWPPDHTGWRLQVQTNPLTFGLGTNWLTVPNSTNVNQFATPINPTNGSVFFRLTYP